MAGPGDDLFMALAQAKAQPDRWARAFNEGVGAVKDTAGGYLQGLQMKQQMQEYPLKLAGEKAELFSNYSKLADAVGPDRASQLMGPTLKGAGIDVSAMPSSTPGVGTEYTPDQLGTMGTFGKTRLENMATTQKISETGPRDPASVKSNLVQSGMSPEAADAWLSVNMDSTGHVQNKNFEDLMKGISAKNQGTRVSMMSPYFNARAGVLQLGQLPSQMGPQTAAGAAYQVQLAAHQGKALIATPGAYQRLGMTQGDAARALLRNAPTDEAMRNANFSDTFIGRFNKIKAAITADPTQIDQPLMRKGLYDALDEMERSSKPFIANHLQNMEANDSNSTFGDKWGNVKQREMGLNIPDVPFDPGTNSVPNPNISTGIPYKTATSANGQKIRSKDNWATFEPVPQGQ